MKKFIFTILISGFLFNGCTTMYFHNGDVSQNPEVTNNQTHVNMLFSLIETSDPLVLNHQCAEDWETIKVERTFGDGLIGILENLVVGVDIFDLQTLSYQCRE
ncbi:tmRNA [Thiovulum sp. ES]|nr:tmRNA [Thiovulum sp. ES]